MDMPLRFLLLLGALLSVGCAAARADETPSPAPSPAPVGPLTPATERAFLPSVTAVERWREIAVVGQKQNFAPGIVPLREGGWRIFWNDATVPGITSATTQDGLTFTADAGVRLGNGADGSQERIASHPWLIAVDGGYRMYYQGNSNAASAPEPSYRVFSAFSTDGLTFTREGLRVDQGTATGLIQAAHGRILRRADGVLRMWFSATPAVNGGPGTVLGATSLDGLTFQLDRAPVLDRLHDPTVLALPGGGVQMYSTYLAQNLLRLESADGLTFTPVAWQEFYDRSGNRYEEFGDVEVLQKADGTLYLYGSGKGSNGLSVMVRAD